MTIENVERGMSILCRFDNQSYQIRVNKINIDGWTLYECFLEQEAVVYFSQERGGEPLAHIDMGDAVPLNWKETIKNAIQRMLRLQEN